MPSNRKNNDFHPLNDIDPIIHSPARLTVMSYLYVVDSADYVFLMRMTGLTWGNLSTHLGKLEDAGYIEMIKGYKGKKPHTVISLSKKGRRAFQKYKKRMKKVLDDIPD